MASNKVHPLTKENLDLLQRSLGPNNPQESYALRVLLEEQIRLDNEARANTATNKMKDKTGQDGTTTQNHQTLSGILSSSEMMATLSLSSVPTPDPEESLKLYMQMPPSGNDHPVERFLTPGATFEPLWFVKRELAALEIPYGDTTSLEKRILLGQRNYSDIKPDSRERKLSP